MEINLQYKKKYLKYKHKYYNLIVNNIQNGGDFDEIKKNAETFKNTIVGFVTDNKDHIRDRIFTISKPAIMIIISSVIIGLLHTGVIISSMHSQLFLTIALIVLSVFKGYGIYSDIQEEEARIAKEKEKEEARIAEEYASRNQKRWINLQKKFLRKIGFYELIVPALNRMKEKGEKIHNKTEPEKWSSSTLHRYGSDGEEEEGLHHWLEQRGKEEQANKERTAFINQHRTLLDELVEERTKNLQDTYQKQLQELQSDLEEVRNDKESMEKVGDEAAKAERLERHLEESRKKQETQRNALERVQLEGEQLLRDNLDFELTNSQLVSENETLKMRTETQEKENERLTEQLADKDNSAEAETLKNANEKLAQKIVELGQLRTELEAVKAAAEEAPAAEVETARAKLEAVQSENKELEDKKTDLEKDIADLEEKRGLLYDKAFTYGFGKGQDDKNFPLIAEIEQLKAELEILKNQPIETILRQKLGELERTYTLSSPLRKAVVELIREKDNLPQNKKKNLDWRKRAVEWVG